MELCVQGKDLKSDAILDNISDPFNKNISSFCLLIHNKKRKPRDFRKSVSLPLGFRQVLDWPRVEWSLL